MKCFIKLSVLNNGFNNNNSAGEGAVFHRLLIPSKWAGAIIGKGGVMINKLRDEVSSRKRKNLFFDGCTILAFKRIKKSHN